MTKKVGYRTFWKYDISRAVFPKYIFIMYFEQLDFDTATEMRTDQSRSTTLLPEGKKYIGTGIAACSGYGSTPYGTFIFVGDKIKID